MAEVILQDIEKLYGEVAVVRKLNLHVADGEFLVLVGASGCGKSTTLRMVAGLEAISAGTLRIGERVVNDVHPRDRDIAMVFQSYALYPHMSVYENMAFGLRLRKVAVEQIDSRVTAAAELLGLTTYLQRKPAALSGGQRQRVAMGRAVVREPSVFLFDEPLSNLDAKLRVQMRLEIAKLHKRLRTTILYVTHDQIEAMTLADRIAVMHEGLLQQCATPDEIYRKPANTYVATFIGSPSMNLWPVTYQNGALVAPGLRVEDAGELVDNTQYTLGVRPQDLQVVAATEADLTLQVDVVEPLGPETFLFGERVGQEAAMYASRDISTCLRGESASIVRLEAGAQRDLRLAALPLKIDRSRAHLFDVRGQRIAQFDRP